MAYSEELAVRVRGALLDQDVREVKMFGGLCFMVRGNMCCGVMGDSLMLRIGEGPYEESLRQPNVRPMDFTGRPMRGSIIVGPPGLADDESLARWVGLGLAFNRSLPEKTAASRRRRRTL